MTTLKLINYIAQNFDQFSGVVLHEHEGTAGSPVSLVVGENISLRSAIETLSAERDNTNWRVNSTLEKGVLLCYPEREVTKGAEPAKTQKPSEMFRDIAAAFGVAGQILKQGAKAATSAAGRASVIEEQLSRPNSDALWFYTTREELERELEALAENLTKELGELETQRQNSVGL